MKKIVAALLCFLMILSLFSCRNKSIEDINYNPDNSTSSDASDDPTTNNTSANYDSVLRVYRRIVDSYPIVNQNPRALAAELGIQGEENTEIFVDLYSSVMMSYPGRVESDGESPHYKLGYGYAVKDLNGDGVDELILMNDDYYIMAVFSYADEKPILLGIYRNRNFCWIDGDGLIHNNGSSGAAYSTNAVYKIADGGKELELIAEFGTDGVEWIEDVAYTIYYKLVDGEKKTITEAEYQALDEKYGKYLGSVAGTKATKEYSGLVFTPMYTEAEIAMEMYEAVIKGEICVVDEHLGEIKLAACRFPSNNLKIDECEILSKAILDMDGDGFNEYVIQSEAKDHIVLHYYNGKVYSYCFDSKNFFNLNTDGSFYWIDSYELDNCTRGSSQIAFDGSSPRIKEIYRIKQTSLYDYGDDDHEYYVNGRQITREEFRDHYDSNCRSKKGAIFSPLDISCEYPISSEKAYEFASKHWGVENGMSEGAAGTRYVSKIVVLEKPNSDTQSYRIGWLCEGYTTHVIDSCYAQPPKSVTIHEQLFVDAITGECRDYIESELDTEAEIAMKMYEAAIKGEIYVVDEQLGKISLNDCRFLTNNVTVGECKFINKAILDMDGDGINEYIIQSGDEADHIVLHYYEGKVYSYSFGVTEFRHLNTNGTFYWFSNYWVCGLSRLVFNGSSMSIEEIYKMNMCEDTDPENDAYYIEGKQVTYGEFIDQFSNYKRDHITRKSFSPLEIDCSYPISSERALEIASEYWDVSDWDYDCAAGTTIADRIVLSSKPSDENGYYRIIWKLEYYWHAYPCWEGQTTSTTYIYKEVIVDAFTGECRKYTEPVPDGKG